MSGYNAYGNLYKTCNRLLILDYLSFNCSENITSRVKMKTFVAIIALCALVITSNAVPYGGFSGGQSESGSASSSNAASQTLNQGKN